MLVSTCGPAQAQWCEVTRPASNTSLRQGAKDVRNRGLRKNSTETASFTGALAFGGLSAGATGMVTPYICAALGVPSGGAGAVACSLVLIGIGSYIGGKSGETGGEWIGEHIYEQSRR